MQQFRVGNKRAEIGPQIKEKDEIFSSLFAVCPKGKTTYIELLGAAAAEELRERVMTTESAPDSGRNEVRFFSVVCCRTN